MSQNYNCVAPEPFNFSNPGDWPKWIRRFERFRQASGLINNPENEQVNMLVYCMGDNADDILLSCKIASDQLENYDGALMQHLNNGYPRYRRRDDGQGTHQVDNRWVVPYNPYLLVRFNAHINVEFCASVKSVKYIFIYLKRQRSPLPSK
ncbi:hypothetical protein LAZ67_13001882 [Cordylochernes scorpioides]|uniref:Uncharacterized protein n=1 Tax=Cordylochernes scorpioides TaxID=51811 RepID=A0ABY6L907_9ARAC|nr:hypothetical protein LAZ67_13001882 [Cordylochernes scorpioides]